MKSISVIIMSLFTSIFHPIKVIGQSTPSETLDTLTAKIQAEYKIPAIAVSVIKSDTRYYGIQGTTKINGDNDVTLENKFHLGSNSKAITSFIAMKMASEGKIRFDTQFIELFPELKDSINLEYDSITLGDLLSHQAKVQPYTSGIDFIKLPKFSGEVSDKRRAFTRFVLNEKSVKKGTYSNAGYVIASLMLEKASSLTFEELVKKYLSELDLECYFGFPNKENQTNPWGHWMESGMLIPLGAEHFYKLEDYMLAAGDIAMNLVDYSRFIQIHLQGLQGKSDYLTKEAFETLHFKYKGLAYGWGNNGAKTDITSFHDGSAGTYYCHAMLFPHKDLAVIVLTNSAAPEHVKGIYKLRKLIVQNEKLFYN